MFPCSKGHFIRANLDTILMTLILIEEVCESSVVLEYISSRLMNVHKLTFDVNRRTENLEKVPPCVSNNYPCFQQV